MNEYLSSDFWERIDDIIFQKKETLIELAKNCGINYETIRASRKRDVLLKTCDTARISDYLSVSMDYLVKGRDNLNLSHEALLVESNLTYRQLIRGCEEIPELLPALTSLLQVGRKEEIEKPS